MRYFIVHAHHEPRSFSGALTTHAREKLFAAGHEVVVSDLNAMHFDPVSDRRNFTTLADAHYLKQQAEEQYASQHDGFAPDVEREIRKLESCDVLVFQFPLWWFGMPAILKGWCDRVLAMGRVYGGGKWYEHGIGAGRPAIVSMTTGGPPPMYGSAGLNPQLTGILAPIHHGVFWFNGFRPAAPFITWGVSRQDAGQRAARLERWGDCLLNIGERPALPHLPASTFSEGGIGIDIMPRYMVSWTRTRGDEGREDRERAAITRLRGEGVVLDAWDATHGGRGGFVARAESPEALRERLEASELGGAMEFVIDQLQISEPE